MKLAKSGEIHSDLDTGMLEAVSLMFGVSCDSSCQTERSRRLTNQAVFAVSDVSAEHRELQMNQTRRHFPLRQVK